MRPFWGAASGAVQGPENKKELKNHRNRDI